MSEHKILPLKKLKNCLLSLKKKGKKIVFTNGCFDILHYGHIFYLKKAKKLGDVLVVAVNSDSSIRKIKGKSRPIIPLKDRIRIIAALDCVDFVTSFNQKTPLSLIKTLKPDILVKGADWRIKDIVGSDLVKSYNGKIARIKFLDGYSTTNIIKKIKNQQQ